MGSSALDAELFQAWAVRQLNFPPIIGFDHPRRTLAVSLTGTRCALNCGHCGGFYLRSMRPIQEAKANGATSCLISGGCDEKGQVPVLKHLDRVAALRDGRRLNWHVGLITEREILKIAPLVDAVSFDFVGDEATIQEVYGLEVGVEAYVEAYRTLRRHVPVVPHITIGLRGGSIGHEAKALELLGALGMEALVFLVFIPTKGARYETMPPPPLSQVVRLLIQARLDFQDLPIHLGCMRPYGAYRERLDKLAILAGVNRIVNPTRGAVELARSLGLEAIIGEECCVFGLERFRARE